MDDEPLQPLHWIASSLDDLRDLPDAVQDTFGYALYLAQNGTRHGKAKGIATPASHLDRVRKRLKAAEDDYANRYGSKKS